MKKGENTAILFFHAPAVLALSLRSLQAAGKGSSHTGSPWTPPLQKYHFILFYFPLFQWASASQLLLFLKQTLTHEGAINAGRAPIAHVFGRDAGPGAVPIPLAGPCSPLSPAALPCPFVEIYRAEWAENK